MARAEITYRRLNPSERTLLGPDLSNPSPRARQGLIATLQGANDPEFLGVLEHARDLLRDLWRTDNPDTFIFPGSEEAGAEAVLANLIEPGDAVIVGVIGFAGERLAEAVGRLGADVVRVEADWGSPLEPEALERALTEQRAAPRRARARRSVHGRPPAPFQPGRARPRRGSARRRRPVVHDRGGRRSGRRPRARRRVDRKPEGAERVSRPRPRLVRGRGGGAGREPWTTTLQLVPRPGGPPQLRGRRPTPPDPARTARLRAHGDARARLRAGHGLPRSPGTTTARRR